MAGTQADMKTRIASEMARSDLSSQIALAITDAITIYQKDRFRFNETVPGSEPTLTTTIGQQYYSTADLSNIGTGFFFDYILALIGTTWEPMTRQTPEQIRMLLQTGQNSGPPSDWAYEGNTVMVYPRPGGNYQLLFGGHWLIAAPASDTEANNVWMTQAERLIRSRAKYELAVNVTRNLTMAKAMSPHPPPDGETEGHATYWALKELKREAAKITGRSRVKPMFW